MRFNLLASILFASSLTVGAVLAQAAIPAALTSAYQAGVAGKICKPAPDSAKSSKLGDAVQRAEQKSGLAQADLDAAWADVQAAAQADADFCAKAPAMIDAAIKAAQ